MENVNSSQAKAAYRIVLKNSNGRSVVAELETAADLTKWIDKNGEWKSTYSSDYQSLHAKAGTVPARGSGYVNYALEVQIYEPTISVSDDERFCLCSPILAMQQSPTRREMPDSNLSFVSYRTIILRFGYASPSCQLRVISRATGINGDQADDSAR